MEGPTRDVVSSISEQVYNFFIINLQVRHFYLGIARERDQGWRGGNSMSLGRHTATAHTVHFVMRHMAYGVRRACPLHCPPIQTCSPFPARVVCCRFPARLLAVAHIKALINCAAVLPPKRELTADGLETVYAVNVLGSFRMMLVRRARCATRR